MAGILTAVWGAKKVHDNFVCGSNAGKAIQEQLEHGQCYMGLQYLRSDLADRSKGEQYLQGN